MVTRGFVAATWIAMFLPLASLGLASSQAAELVDYVRDVKPILIEHCRKCHGPNKREAGLRIDLAAALLEGSDSGAVVVPSKATESLIWQAISGLEGVSKMPPEGESLSAREITTLKNWIDQGAHAPEDEVMEDVQSDHWSFQPPMRPALGKSVNPNWAKNGIDFFVMEELSKRGLVASMRAPRETLVRRVSFDVRGLPPALDEIETFVEDPSPDAYERMVDRQLVSPAYGERWGRHWLDQARYADSNGYTRDFGREIWKYRDWVIQAFNRDLPFDQFTVEQIAGDLLPDATLEQRIATGFHRNTLINGEGGTDQEQFRVDAVADRVATTGAVFLGLTLGCARCHQHKFDPLSQREYYQIFAFFNNCDEPTMEAPSDWQIADGWVEKRTAMLEEIKVKQDELKGQQAEIEKKQREWETTITPERRAKYPGNVQEAILKAFDERDGNEKKLVGDVYLKTDEARASFALIDEINALREAAPQIATTMVLQERSDDNRRKTHVHRRGNFLDHGALVVPQVPAVLHPIPTSAERPNRLDFAKWLVDAGNPLTPRVVVNRYWQRFFGRGLVETENDFGMQGSLPTHPQLLEWLATEFMTRQWGIKSMHRLVLCSASYRQSSRYRADLAVVDPRNDLLGRQNRIRLESEMIRDNALSVSGLLAKTIGGPSVHPPQPDGVFAFTQDPKGWNTDVGTNRFRRGMYTFFWRSSPYPSLMVFDFPRSNVTCTRRVRSNTPIQALTLANDVQFIECARELAKEVLEVEMDEARRVALTFRVCLGRWPNAREATALKQVLQKQQEEFSEDLSAAHAFAGLAEPSSAASDEQIGTVLKVASWTALCRVIMNVDEFITRE
ncbi:MAG: PSD1 and planctomycete cytochrome C domain-containing protein [Pirellulaceae bacterium]|nr:PSD1 and planctomycete cytochrome C domain-containing protein [Pirellulaceae bacterium]